MFYDGVTYTDLRPRWVVTAKGHLRGGKALTLRFNDLNELVASVARLRAFGYSLIRTCPTT